MLQSLYIQRHILSQARRRAEFLYHEVCSWCKMKEKGDIILANGYISSIAIMSLAASTYCTSTLTWCGKDDKEIEATKRKNLLEIIDSLTYSNQLGSLANERPQNNGGVSACKWKWLSFRWTIRKQIHEFRGKRTDSIQKPCYIHYPSIRISTATSIG